MPEALGIAIVVVALVPVTFRAAVAAMLDRSHRRRTGRSVPQRRRHRHMRTLTVCATAVAVVGAVLVALTH